MAASPTIQEIIDRILATTPYDPAHDTVDTVKLGDPAQPVTGIVTTFLASYAVIERSIAISANLIITHEPIFYNHRDKTDWLQDDAVYQAKRRLIEEHNLVVWRFHDYWHQHEPDGIIAGELKALAWESYADADEPWCCSLPPTRLEDLVAHLKDKLGVAAVRVVGQPGMVCRRAALLVGAIGGHFHISVLGRDDIDVAICGEINEWDTSEYVRDAIRLGQNKALIVVGHAPSEEAGMAYLADWLRQHVAGVPIAHIPSGNALRFV